MSSPAPTLGASIPLPGRFVGLDVFRGITIAAMILVNNPGDWSKTYGPLLHAAWDGWTPTDLVFPFFLVAVGVAIPFAFGRRLESAGGARGPLYRQILRRTVILFGLGLVLNWFPFYTVEWSRARIPGVLQRIAIVYAVAALAYLHLGPRARLVLGGVLLAAYGLAMKLVPVPGFGRGDLGVEGNLAAWVDSLVLGPHVWRYAPGPGDPEGLLSTVPAVVTALIGIAVGERLRSDRLSTRSEPQSMPLRLLGLFVAGSVGMAAGLVLAWWWPINKNLWSVSYAVFTGAMAAVAIAVIATIVDVWGKARWTGPFEVFGANAIAAFVGSSLMARCLALIKVGEGEAALSLKTFLYRHSVELVLPEYLASLVWALLYLALWWWLIRLLHTRGIFLKI